MQRHRVHRIAAAGFAAAGLACAAALITGCHTTPPSAGPIPGAAQDSVVDGTMAGTVDGTVAGTVDGDDLTDMQAAIDAGTTDATGVSAAGVQATSQSGLALAPNAPGSYVVKRGDTLWAIAKVFLRDPWFWPEIWQVNPQVQNPHLIYPGDTLRLVYMNGQPKLMLQRGDTVRVEPRVRIEPLDAAVTAIPYEAVAAFMSRPSVLSDEQIKGAPYVLSTRDQHVIMSEGNTLYARGFSSPTQLGTHYNIVRVGDELRDPDDDEVVGYDGIFTGAGHVTRLGDPTTLIMTESARETVPGDKLFAGGSDVALDFVPSAPKSKISGRIMAVSDGVTVIGQYQVVVINRGARDGVAAGNVLAVFDVGDTVRDTVNRGYLGGMRRVGAPRVQLPDERSGTFMVFKAFDRLSYGLIMEAKDIIRVADRVVNP